MSRKGAIYLGISGVYSHDAAAALVIDGKVVAAAEEERFSRQKHTGAFPRNAIEFCLGYAGVSASDVDCVAYYFDPVLRYLPSLSFNLRTAIPKARHIRRMGGSWHEVVSGYRDAIRVEKRIIRGITLAQSAAQDLFPSAEFRKVRHHDAHAASAFYASPFETCSVITIDLIGEWDTTSFYSGEGTRLRRLGSVRFPDSLGKLYQAFTKFLGFKPNSDEYKVMGLSAYGTDRFVPFFKTLYRLTENGFELNPEVLLFCKGVRPEWDDQITSVIGNPRESEGPICDNHKDIAFAVQKATEHIELHLVRSLIASTGQKDLCMAGGVALNALANQRIRESGLINRFFVQPAANDAGASLGAALYAFYADNPSTERKPMTNCYLGPEYSSGEYNEIVQSSGFKITYGDTRARTAELLAQGMIVGLFQGRMEFGPRALGNRSILADPRNPAMKARVNERIKFREGFRPFAPAVLEEAAAKYFLQAVPSPFMTQTFSATAIAHERIPATIHADGTARIQTVAKDTNLAFYNIISRFAELTGIPVLLNTSFNIAGEPIVCTPKDALNTFRNSGLDALILEELVVEK